MIKKIMLVIGVVILIVLIVPIFLPTHFSMSRTVEIQAPVGVVFSKLTDLREYVKWNPFPEGDPTNKTNVTGDGLNSSLIWKGDKTGEGKMTITNIKSEKDIAIKMEFYKPMSGEGVVHWITNAKTDSKTEMVWTFDQDLSYFNRYFGLMMDAMMGKHFEKGLLNLKDLLEAPK